eukprot:COSAG05_NODE_21602_length_270_cov_1.514620_1_plen_65_part_01
MVSSQIYSISLHIHASCVTGLLLKFGVDIVQSLARAVFDWIWAEQVSRRWLHPSDELEPGLWVPS